MSKIIRAFATLALVLAGNGGAALASDYLQRSDTITLGAGNAKDVNAAIHVIDPWPRHSGNVRIRADGDRMVGAVQRYKRGPSQRGGGQPGQLTNPAAAAAAPASSDSSSSASPVSAPATSGSSLRGLE